MGAQILPSQPTFPLKIVGNVRRPPGRSGRTRRRRENSDSAPEVKFPNLVPGSVTILKRGEELKTKTTGNKSAAGPPSDADEKSPKIDEARSEKKVRSSNRTPHTVGLLGPAPQMVPKQSWISHPKPIGVVYAGSGFSTSPEPSSLPLPGFFAKAAGNRDLATDDLRRLLRLDLL